MKAFYIPNGPKNIASIFPAINLSNVRDYYIQVKDFDSTVLATGTINQIIDQNCNKQRVHFVNYSGAVDAVNFDLMLDEHTVKSDTYTKTIPYILDKTRGALNRTNIKASDIKTLSNTEYAEKDQPWLNELIDSPLALLEWPGIQGQPAGYMPIVILDTKMVNRKIEDRYQYELIMQIQLSHDRYIIRN